MGKGRNITPKKLLKIQKACDKMMKISRWVKNMYSTVRKTIFIKYPPSVFVHAEFLFIKPRNNVIFGRCSTFFPDVLFFILPLFFIG